MDFANVSPKKLGIRHLQISLMFMAHFIAYKMHSCMSVAVLAMTDTKSNRTDVPISNWSPDKTSLILSSDLWGTVAAQIPFGFITVKYNAQKIMSCAIMICSLMYFLIPMLAVKFGWVAVLCSSVIVGLGLAALEPCQQSLLSRWAPPAERAQLGATVFAGANLGIVCSMFVSGLLAGSPYGWPSIFYVFGGIAAVWTILFFFLAANGPAQHPRISPEEKYYIENCLGVTQHEKEVKSFKFPLKSLITSVPIWAFLICVCCQLWCFYVTMTQLPNFIKNILGLDIQKVGGIAALPYIAKALIAPIIGWFSDFMITESLNAGIVSAHLVNALDLCPNFSGTVYSIVNTIGQLFGLLAPIAVVPLWAERNIEQLHIVFYISVGTYFFVNLVFIIFGSAERQPWNEPKLSNDQVPEVTTVTNNSDNKWQRIENCSYVEE